MSNISEPQGLEPQDTQKKPENLEPSKKFKDLLQNEFLLTNLKEKMGFEIPTPIQAAVMPAILEGRDVYAGARTGSGKTIAFLGPIAQMLFEKKIRRALVLSPTRELALQIDDEAMKLLDGQTEHVSIPLYGGVPLDQQLRAMNAHKPTLYIATPGRMIDFIGEGCISLGEIDLCVLDEADRMCDMGFAPQVTEILNTLPGCRQTLMFSATLPKEVNQIMSTFLKNPYEIQVDSPNTSSSTIEHRAIFVNRREKVGFLRSLLRDQKSTSIIFCRTRKGADNLFERVSERGRNSAIGILHAGFSMGERERTIRQFKEGRIQHLIATDVASRGLDVDHVTQVVHFELPESLDDYIHRAGRSGRAGRAGLSIALVDPENSMQERQIEAIAEKIKIELVRDFSGTGGEGDRDSRSSSSDAGPRRSRGSRNSRNNRRPSSNRERSGSESRGEQNRNPRRSRSRKRTGDGPRPSDQKRSSEPRKSSREASKRSPQAQKPAKAKSGLLKKASKMIGRVFGKKK
ncbi:MAG: DEAD/DEAH box helicase [Bradymonadales bacterium]|nr:MAG: DEAD/DEAH box helicase [Bradymonadales bacterium]